MRLPRRSTRRLAAALVVALVSGGLVLLVVKLGMDVAWQVSTVGAFGVALVALVLTYLMPTGSTAEAATAATRTVSRTDLAFADGGGDALSGMRGPADVGRIDVRGTGPAIAHGPGSRAVSGADLGSPPER